YLYAAPKIGFHFAKDSEKNEYAVTGYYYEDASDTLTIPSTYNDLPVATIAEMEIPNETETITIPSSITNLAGLVFEIQNAENLATINYEGTKAQWQELGISNNALANIEINCSDGALSDTYKLPEDITLDELVEMILDRTITSFSLDSIDDDNSTMYTYTFDENMFYTYNHVETDDFVETVYNYIFEEDGWYYILTLLENENEVIMGKTHDGEYNSVSYLLENMINSLFKDDDAIITNFVNNETSVEFDYQADYRTMKMRFYDFNVTKTWELPSEFDNYQTLATEN
ncbi:MAG: hypothetical protein NC037_06305, partial [Bacteroides sp.]|nr:hypothetical protein [Bacillota bacterium]MCM1393395.1 hypothetical protein [[Eubacterium] siraeum]MCM1456116.1 hypothetical protein [Bacteroides sp.]